MSRKKWVVANTDKETARALAEECGIEPMIALMLMSRGIDDPFEIEEFLDTDAVFSDPFEIVDMQKASDRIIKAVDSGEKIAVFGDYDADGITATLIVYTYLKKRGADVTYYIPDRLNEGYGMNTGAIDTLNSKGVSLIITVDNGINAIKEIEYSSSLGIDVVVTDHHLPGGELPRAVAVVDPHRKDNYSTFSDYAGVGVAFMLICAVDGCSCNDLINDFADLAAVGTVADIVPLLGENRMLVREGLKAINRRCRPGLNALIEVSNLSGREINATHLAFAVAPRINATGRMGSAQLAFELLLCDDPQEAAQIATEVNEKNLLRQETEAEITKEAEEIILKTPKMKYDRVLVVSGENWHCGVLGIVASRLSNRFGRPAIVLTSDGEISNGSARSIDGFDIFKALCACSDILTRFGGHKQAAGTALRTEDIQLFRKKINSYAATTEMPVPELHIDCRLNPVGVTFDTAMVIKQLEPFGCSNTSPLFGLFGMELYSAHPVGNGKHLRITVKKNDLLVKAMLFSTTLTEFKYNNGDKIDLVVALDISEFRGEDTLSVIIRGIRPSGNDEDAFFDDNTIFEAILRGDEITPEKREAAIPGREETVKLFRELNKTEGFDGNIEYLLYRMNYEISFLRLLVSLEALREAGIITVTSEKNGELTHIILNDVKEKRDLNATDIIKFLNKGRL